MTQTVRGTFRWATPEPEYEPLPKGLTNLAAREVIKARNSALKIQHETVRESERQINDLVNEGNHRASPTSIGVRDLESARFVRENAEGLPLGHLHAPYDNPAEYIADLCADQYLDKDRARALLTKLQKDGSVKLDDDEQYVYAAGVQNGSIPRVPGLDNAVQQDPASTIHKRIDAAPSLSDKYKHAASRDMWDKHADEIPDDKDAPLPTDSVAGLLQEEYKRQHISQAEFKVMMAWERQPELGAPDSHMAALHQHVTQELESADLGLDRGDAIVHANGVIKSILADPLDAKIEQAVRDYNSAPRSERILAERATPKNPMGRG